jgi:HAMP domain-containing protein
LSALGWTALYVLVGMVCAETVKRLRARRHEPLGNLAYGAFVVGWLVMALFMLGAGLWSIWFRSRRDDT